MGKLEKLMFSIGVRDEASGPVGKLQKVLNSTQKQAGAAFGKIGGGALAVAGAGLAVQTLVAPALEMNRALAEGSSLDVDAKGLRMLDATAKRYAMSYGGSAKEFVDASYAIQSGIAGLTGEELSSFTYASAVMAKATKADASTMTAYTGTMYGIFQKQAEAQGKAAWIEDMAGKTAHAIKVFKTSGYEMSSAFTALGANATSAGISLDEQMAILGKLQATMSGSEAGTKYKAFLRGVGNAQKELGMTFVDSQGKMLPVLQILEKLKKKYGALDRVVDSDLIKKAVRFIKPYVFFDFLFQTFQQQGTWFWRCMQHQFKDSLLKSLYIAPFRVEINDEFLLFKRESMAYNPIFADSVQLPVLRNEGCYRFLHGILLLLGILVKERSQFFFHFFYAGQR